MKQLKADEGITREVHQVIIRFDDYDEIAFQFDGDKVVTDCIPEDIESIRIIRAVSMLGSLLAAQMMDEFTFTEEPLREGEA